MAAPQGATTFIPYSFACAAPSTASRMSPPSRSRIPVVAGLRYSEHALSRGNRARSTSSTDAPARASSMAVVAPAGPAPTTTTSQRSVTTSPRSGRRNVRAEHGRGRADERRREIHAVVVEPSPTLRESYQLVADRIAALEPRVARGTLVLALQRRAQEGVREHARHACSREYDKPRSHAPRCQRGGQSGNERRAGHAAQRSQRRDTPRRAAGHPPPGGDEARRERRIGADFGGPGIGGSGRDGADSPGPRAEQRGHQGDGAVGQHLPRGAARAPALGELREDATGEEESGEQRESRPAEAPCHAGPDGAGCDEPAGGEPPHSSNSSSKIRRFRSAGAPSARHRARRKPRNSFTQSNCSPHGGQSVRC